MAKKKQLISFSPKSHQLCFPEDKESVHLLPQMVQLQLK